LSTRKQIITIIVVDVAVIINNKINGIYSMNEELETYATVWVKKIHRNKPPGIPRCRQMAG
jgi:hypothetical protein